MTDRPESQPDAAALRAANLKEGGADAAAPSAAAHKEGGSAAGVLARLFETIRARRGADASQSYTAALFAGGAKLICRKVAEEATEVTVEGLKGDAPGLARESADLLYHLLVLWAQTGVVPEDVWTELARREGTSGLAEKAARPNKD